MASLIHPNNTWPLWGVMLAGVALCIYLEQNHKWAAKISGPVLAIVGAMLLSNFKLMPIASASYDVVDDYFVPIAIPLLLFRANVVRIVRESGTMFLAFHVASIGTILGAFVAAFLFRDSVDRVAEVAGIMTGSYIGGGVNFVAIRNSYNVSSNLANPLMVADNFIMAGFFAVLFLIAGSKFFRRHYPHPHSSATGHQESQKLAAEFWQRKEIALLDIAKALAVAVAIAAVSVKLSGMLKANSDSKLIHSIFGNAYVLITVLTVTITTLFHRWMERIHGTEELGVFLLYIFFFVIGLRANLWEVAGNMPILFLFCLVMAIFNLATALIIGRLLRLNLEEVLLSVNATLGGPPTAAAMAITMGWPKLVLPGLLAGLWGYTIGTFVGIVVAEALLRLL
jgi:uncharacterized membrane protein